MGNNLYDGVLDGITEIIEDVSDSISMEFKGTNPFDTQPVDKRQALFDITQLDPEVQSALSQNLGSVFDDYLQKLGGNNGGHPLQ